MKKVLIILILLFLPYQVQAENYYAFGVSGNTLIGVEKDGDKYFIQVNGDVSYHINKPWAKNLYVGFGIRENNILIVPLGYYLWHQRIGVQFGIWKLRGEDNYRITYGLFADRHVFKWIWENFKKIGDELF